MPEIANRRLIATIVCAIAVVALCGVLIAVSSVASRRGDKLGWAYCEAHGYACICNDGVRVWVASERPIRNVCEWTP